MIDGNFDADIPPVAYHGEFRKIWEFADMVSIFAEKLDEIVFILINYFFLLIAS